MRAGYARTVSTRVF